MSKKATAGQSNPAQSRLPLVKMPREHGMTERAEKRLGGVRQRVMVAAAGELKKEAGQGSEMEMW